MTKIVLNCPLIQILKEMKIPENCSGIGIEMRLQNGFDPQSESGLPVWLPERIESCSKLGKQFPFR